MYYKPKKKTLSKTLFSYVVGWKLFLLSFGSNKKNIYIIEEKLRIIYLCLYHRAYLQSFLYYFIFLLCVS